MRTFIFMQKAELGVAVSFLISLCKNTSRSPDEQQAKNKTLFSIFHRRIVSVLETFRPFRNENTNILAVLDVEALC